MGLLVNIQRRYLKARVTWPVTGYGTFFLSRASRIGMVMPGLS